MKTLNISTLVALALAGTLAVACGGDDKPSPPAAGPATADLLRALDCSQPKADTSTATRLSLTADDEEAADEEGDGEEEPSEADEFAELVPRHVPAEQLHLKVKDTEPDATLCDALRAAKSKKIALVSFVSAKCDECLGRAKSLGAELKAAKATKRVLSLVVVTDAQGSLDAKAWAELKKKTAKDATWGFDSRNELWRFFAQPGDTNTKPYVLVMDYKATGFLDTDVEHDAGYLLRAADHMLKLGVATGSETGTDTHTETGTGTSTTTNTSSATSTSTSTASGTGTGTGTGTNTRTGTGTATGTGTRTATAI